MFRVLSFLGVAATRGESPRRSKNGVVQLKTILGALSPGEIVRTIATALRTCDCFSFQFHIGVST